MDTLAAITPEVVPPEQLTAGPWFRVLASGPYLPEGCAVRAGGLVAHLGDDGRLLDDPLLGVWHSLYSGNRIVWVSVSELGPLCGKALKLFNKVVPQ